MKFITIVSIGTLFLSKVRCFAPVQQSSAKIGTNLYQSDSNAETIEVASMPNRRSVLASIAAAGFAGLANPPISSAATTKKKKSPRTYFKGKITLKDGEMPNLGDYKSIFISARPKNPASIPPEVVASARAGVPAVFFAVVPNPKFPAEFTLTENDITPEGDFGLSSDPYWWAEDAEWEISARVDTDGAVRTLDANDLVGRTITSQPGQGSPDTEVCVAVKERGFFGSYYQRKD